jgi:hypothetical protein
MAGLAELFRRAGGLRLATTHRTRSIYAVAEFEKPPARACPGPGCGSADAPGE